MGKIPLDKCSLGGQYLLFYDKESEQTINRYLYAMDLGFTTVRDCGDSHVWATVALSKAIAANTADYLLDNIDGTDSVRRMSRLAIRKGAAFLKLYGSASIHSTLGEPGLPIIEPDEIREAVQVAKRYGTYVSIHCHGAEAIDNAVRSGVHTVEHASLISEETLQYLDANGEDFGIVPTLSVIYGTASPEKTDPVAVRARQLLDTICECLQNAYRHNVRMGFGRDVTQKDYVVRPDLEFRLRKELLHFRDEDILKQATIDSARLLHKEDEIGSIKIGKKADLIVVDGDPSRDISVMYTKPIHVIKGGKLVR